MALAAQTVRTQIFQLMRGRQTMTRQEIARALSLSMPTTLQNVTELLEAGVLEECGTIQSNGGRKAKKLRLCRDTGYAAGIHVGIHHVEIVVTDLLGTLRQTVTIPLTFQDKPDWYARFREVLLTFLRERQIDPGQILGVGVSFPGIINAQGTQVIRSHIMGLTRMELDRFRKTLPFPSTFANDANCACFAERKSSRDSYVYVSLDESVGGAVMLHGHLWLGDTFQAGEIGHMLLYPGGRSCYCGKQGCADAYLSPQALAQDGWDSYLEHLAILLTNLRMFLNLEIVVGGQVGAQIGPHMEQLCAIAAQYDHFARDVDYIIPCTQMEYACAIGAASFALEEFSDRWLLDTMEKDSV